MGRNLSPTVVAALALVGGAAAGATEWVPTLRWLLWPTLFWLMLAALVAAPILALHQGRRPLPVAVAFAALGLGLGRSVPLLAVLARAGETAWILRGAELVLAVCVAVFAAWPRLRAVGLLVVFTCVALGAGAVVFVMTPMGGDVAAWLGPMLFLPLLPLIPLFVCAVLSLTRRAQRQATASADRRAVQWVRPPQERM